MPLAVPRTLFFLLFFAPYPAVADFSHDSDLSIRADESSISDLRWQYRLRIRPSLKLNSEWSLHGFVATGAAFPSAYNTIDNNSDVIHVRRLFGRYQTESGKIEFGVIPPYKGRVSSTGLSKEGWIKGARGVKNFAHRKLEIVLGDIENLRARNALGSDFDLNYYELEYSGRLDSALSYELSVERMFDASFFRTELRYAGNGSTEWGGELVYNATTNAGKIIVSTLRTLQRDGPDLELFAYYAYTDPEFGARAALNEDFLSFDNALGMELKGGFHWSDRVSWFIEAEVGDVRSRIKAGVEIELGR